MMSNGMMAGLDHQSGYNEGDRHKRGDESESCP